MSHQEMQQDLPAGDAAPRVVLDTNIFVAAGFNPRSSAARLLGDVQAGRLRMVWNEETRAETAHILRQIPRLAWAGAAPLFREENRFTGATPIEPFAGIADRDDRKFAALAQAAQATLITNDAHLLDRQAAPGLAAMTPREFLTRQDATID
jgi:predicted nucleic acid-binding protein